MNYNPTTRGCLPKIPWWRWTEQRIATLLFALSTSVVLSLGYLSLRPTVTFGWETPLIVSLVLIAIVLLLTIAWRVVGNVTDLLTPHAAMLAPVEAKFEARGYTINRTEFWARTIIYAVVGVIGGAFGGAWLTDNPGWILFLGMGGLVLGYVWPTWTLHSKLRQYDREARDSWSEVLDLMTILEFGVFRFCWGVPQDFGNIGLAPLHPPPSGGRQVPPPSRGRFGVGVKTRPNPETHPCGNDMLGRFLNSPNSRTISVEAGLGFDAAMHKVADKSDSALGQAFDTVIQKMRIGTRRRVALREMAASLQLPEITSFVAAVIQAEQLGVSIAKILRVQSQQTRESNRQQAEQWSNWAAPIQQMGLHLLLGPAITLWLITLVVFGWS